MACASPPSSAVAEPSLEPPGCEWLLLSHWTLRGVGTRAYAFLVTGCGPERLPVILSFLMERVFERSSWDKPSQNFNGLK